MLTTFVAVILTPKEYFSTVISTVFWAVILTVLRVVIISVVQVVILGVIGVVTAESQGQLH